MRRWIFIITLALAACQADPSAIPQGEVTRPDLINTINWDRNPETVVFRSQVTGGNDSFFLLNDVPYCTIYGDNRIIWTVPGVAGADTVLWDVVADDAIRVFIDTLLQEFSLYNYPALADQQTVENQALPVYEQLTLFVNGNNFTSDTFAGWPFEFFTDITNHCRSISQEPTEFLPDGGWVSVQPVPYNPSRPSSVWDPAATGVDLSAIAASGERTWVTGDPVRTLWQELRIAGIDIQFDQGGETFLVALQVPNVTVNAPPAP